MDAAYTPINGILRLNAVDRRLLAHHRYKNCSSDFWWPRRISHTATIDTTAFIDGGA